MLRDKGGDVFYGENLTIEEFRSLGKQFEDALQPGDISIVFFEGHAYTYKNAMHFVAVTDGEPRMEDHAVNVDALDFRLTQ